MNLRISGDAASEDVDSCTTPRNSDPDDLNQNLHFSKNLGVVSIVDSEDSVDSTARPC